MPPYRATSPMAKMSGSEVRKLVVDDDAAALADHQAAGAGQIVARLDAGRDDDHVDVELGAVGEGHAFDLAVAEDFLGVLVEVDLDAQAR